MREPGIDALFAACEAIGRALRDDPRPHLVAMKSTVLPGACARELVPTLEQQLRRARCPTP